LPDYYNKRQEEECPGGYDPPAAPMDQFLRVFYTSIHELGHLMGLDHIQDEALACPGQDSVMDVRYYPDDSFTTYFCEREITEVLRRDPRYE